MRNQDAQLGGGEGENNERDVLMGGGILGLSQNLVTEKFPGVHRMTPVKTPSNNGEGT